MRWTVNSKTNSKIFEETMQEAIRDMDIDLQGDVWTTFKEALNNCREHGNKFDDSKNIYLCIMVDEKRKTIEVILKDQGSGYDYYKMLHQKVDPMADRGRGHIIMAALTNELLIDCSHGGTQVYFMKKLKKGGK